MSRLFLERECEHGRGVGLPHCPEGHDHGGAVVCDVWCPGGDRREVVVDYEAAWHVFSLNSLVAEDGLRPFVDAAVTAALGLTEDQKEYEMKLYRREFVKTRGEVTGARSTEVRYVPFTVDYEAAAKALCTSLFDDEFDGEVPLVQRKHAHAIVDAALGLTEEGT